MCACACARVDRHKPEKRKIIEKARNRQGVLVCGKEQHHYPPSEGCVCVFVQVRVCVCVIGCVAANKTLFAGANHHSGCGSIGKVGK